MFFLTPYSRYTSIEDERDQFDHHQAVHVRLLFPDADQYRSLLIFNVRHNYYRLIVKVDYRAKLLMIKEFLNHKEYTRGGWRKWAR
jgi:mRNA-degrading endonuclease HigB of HigAB toxin-antitoxin module